MKKPLKKTSKKTSKKISKKISKKPLKKVTKKVLKKPAKKPLKKPSVKPSKKPAKKVSIKPVTVTLSTIKGAKKPLWVPSQDKIKNANMTRFIEFVNKKYGKKFKTYDELFQWSVDSIPDFWAAMWDFAESQSLKKVGSGGGGPEKIPGDEVVSWSEAEFCRESSALS